MNCMDCNANLIHGGDHDADDTNDFLIVSNLSCPKCGNFYLVYRDMSDQEEIDIVYLPEGEIDG